MPGELKPDARCPMCDTPLVALVDTTNLGGVSREYFHQRPIIGRRKRPCWKLFKNHALARRERRSLEK